MKIFMPIIIFVLFMLQGCATPYQALGLRGGFKELRLSKNAYEITFTGNGFTSPTTVANYTLRRCAELTKKRGYKYFIILATKGFDNVSTFTTPTTIRTTGNGYGQGNLYSYGNYGSYNGTYSGYANTTIMPGSTSLIHKYQKVVAMKMLHSKKKYRNAYNAEIILSNYAVKKSR